MKIKSIERPVQIFRCATLVLLGMAISQSAFTAIYASQVANAISGVGYDEALFLHATDALDRFNTFETVISLIQLITMLVLLYRICFNIHATERGIDIQSPGFFIVSFFIPVVSIIIPYFTILKMWRSSALEAERAQHASVQVIPIPKYVYLWWFFSAVHGLTVIYWGLMQFSLTYQTWQDHWTNSLWLILVLAGWILTNVLTLLVLTKLAQRHSARLLELEKQREAEQLLPPSGAPAV